MVRLEPEEPRMPRGRKVSPEQIVATLRQIEVQLAQGMITSSHFGFLGLGWGRLKRWSAGGARWRASEGHGFQELGPRGEHNIGAQGLQVVEEAGSGSKRLAGVPPSA